MHAEVVCYFSFFGDLLRFAFDKTFELSHFPSTARLCDVVSALPSYMEFGLWLASDLKASSHEREPCQNFKKYRLYTGNTTTAYHLSIPIRAFA
jgi:hypothetical protein